MMKLKHQMGVTFWPTRIFTPGISIPVAYLGGLAPAPLKVTKSDKKNKRNEVGQA